MTKRQCQREGCQNHATQLLRFRIWSTATPKSKRTTQNCLSGFLGLSLCDDHLDEATGEADKFFNDAGKIQVSSALGQMGRANPDWESVMLYGETLTPQLTADPKDAAGRA